MRESMPILGTGQNVPFAKLVPFERQALTNHGQTLERIAQRGGLAWNELLDILEGVRWQYRPRYSPEEAERRVRALLAV